VTTGYLRVATIGSEDRDTFEEAEDIRRDLDATHRVVEVLGEGRCLIEEATDEGERWVRVATVDSEYSDDVHAADYLADALDQSEYRVVSVYSESTAYVEVLRS
jgi:hypothetical protein